MFRAGGRSGRCGGAYRAHGKEDAVVSIATFASFFVVEKRLF